jgi:mono/diheme cytochrome c family protein
MAIFRKLLASAAVVAVAGGVALWFLSAPDRLDAETVAGLGDGDATRGEQVFWAGGCASCHAAPGATDDARLSLGGGLRLETGFGTFVAPNISQDPQDGIGMWSSEDLANAMMRGVSPGGSHYYPAFPYTSYARMEPADIADLSAFMKTLPAVAGAAPDHELSFPFNIRRSLGLWKLIYLNDAPAVALDNPSDQVARGQYLVEGLGHCGECHTPRDALGGLELAQWMAGAAAAEGDGNVPNITNSDDGLADWSEIDIITLLETGFTPDYDSVGGSMASVVRNMAELPASDREAIAAYLKAIPPHPNGY